MSEAQPMLFLHSLDLKWESYLTIFFLFGAPIETVMILCFHKFFLPSLMTAMRMSSIQTLGF